MHVRDGMTSAVAAVGPAHTLRDAARLMAEHNCGAAVVLDPEAPGPQVITERDILIALGQGKDPDTEPVTKHTGVGANIIYASPDWSLELAARVMVARGWRHIIVCDGGEVVGVLSMRDVVRCWTEDGATTDLPDFLRDPEAVLALKSGPESNPDVDEKKLSAGRAVLDSVMGF